MYKYAYTVLRYVHDTTTSEFVNVGIALFAPDARFIAAQCRKTHSRVAHTFPGMNGSAFRTSMRTIETAFAELSRRLRDELPLEARGSITDYAQSILPSDDSSLQWSPFGAGICDDPEATLHHLFDRMVSRYDDRRQEERRSDEDIWRIFKHELDARDLATVLQAKTINVPGDELTFRYAWKNGVWNCIEPLSFDLSSADGIRDKAHRWLGHLTSVKEAADPFRVHLLLGAPQEQELVDAFESAISILDKIPVPKSLYREDEVSEFTTRIERDIRDTPSHPSWGDDW